MTRDIDLKLNSTIHNWFFYDKDALASDLLIYQDHLHVFLAFTLSDIDSFYSFIVFYDLLPSNLLRMQILLIFDHFFSDHLIYLGGNLPDDLFSDHLSQVVLAVQPAEVSHQLLSGSHCAVAKAEE